MCLMYCMVFSVRIFASRNSCQWFFRFFFVAIVILKGFFCFYCWTLLSNLYVFLGCFQWCFYLGLKEVVFLSLLTTKHIKCCFVFIFPFKAKDFRTHLPKTGILALIFLFSFFLNSPWNNYGKITSGDSLVALEGNKLNTANFGSNPWPHRYGLLFSAHLNAQKMVYMWDVPTPKVRSVFLVDSGLIIYFN